MTQKVERQDIYNYFIDADTACISIQDKKYIMDYDTLMDVLRDLAQTASKMELVETNTAIPVAYQ